MRWVIDHETPYVYGSMLENQNVLLVEDEFLIARQMADTLEEAGGNVIGPVGTIEEAISLIAGAERIDAALLDVNLGGEMSYPVAYDLLRRGIPFVFLTAYDPSLVAARFREVPVFEKPADVDQVLHAVEAVIAGSPKQKAMP